MNLAMKFLDYRRKTQMSQTSFSGLIGISQPALSAIEKGSVQPTVNTIENLCEALGISMSDFFSDDSAVADASGVGDRIRALRESRGLSQNRLAKMAGISQAGLSAIESTTKSPSVNTLILIARALGVSASSVLGEDESDERFVSLKIPRYAFKDFKMALDLLRSFSSHFPIDSLKVEPVEPEEIDPAAEGRALLESFRQQVPDLDKYRVPDTPPAHEQEEGEKHA